MDEEQILPSFPKYRRLDETGNLKFGSLSMTGKAYGTFLFETRNGSYDSAFQKSPSNTIENLKYSTSASRKRRLDDSVLDESINSPLTKEILSPPCFSSPKNPDKVIPFSPDLACVLDSFESLSEENKHDTDLSDKNLKNGFLNIKTLTQIAPKDNVNLLISRECRVNVCCAALGNKNSELNKPSENLVKNLFHTVSAVSPEPELHFENEIDQFVSINPTIDDANESIEEFIESCCSFFEESLNNAVNDNEKDSSNEVVCQIESKDEDPLGEQGQGCIEHNKAHNENNRVSQSLPPINQENGDVEKVLEKSNIAKTASKSVDIPSSVLKLDSAEASNGAIPESQLPKSECKASLRDDNDILEIPEEEHLINKCNGVPEPGDHLHLENQHPSDFFHLKNNLICNEVKERQSEVKSVTKTKTKNLPAGNIENKEKMKLCSILAKESKIVSKETDLERRKRIYLQCVSSHIADQSKPNTGVIDELLTLMDSVAQKENETGEGRWQHPSDLTSRNCFRKNGSIPKISLQEWQNRNKKDFKRFTSIPKKFLRSAIPNKTPL
ncbi:uncharacterized protein LOC114665160 [Erpetoichthys calabaricus]|uniref:uncharacterized protein LOC114665160 n=1 Tax=Erpetoichthys calabaricus TaxID=27687 RepID=UPI00109FDC0A|nr:uncharacterized protein LOC114665160 [Erpetoichthys calabaricus]XP_051774783.1 uncharacterized protein LOC114665160 [Erpetoichthys calabaricus]XP_051774784.1 uncharacterized protein LOC114665160 [Erpetoichthys calabaricus]